MTAVAIIVALALVLLGFALWSREYGGYMPEPYRGRSCQGTAWRRSFPSASKEDIRAFLSTFAGSFAFRNTQKLQVGPQDEVLAIYRALYLRGGGIDALELETLAQVLEKQYQVEFRDIWHEKLTLGQLFESCTRQQPPQSDA